MPYIYYHRIKLALVRSRYWLPESFLTLPLRTTGQVWEYWSARDVIRGAGDLVKVALPLIELTDTNEQERKTH